MEKVSSNRMVSVPLFWDVAGFLVKLRYFSLILGDYVVLKGDNREESVIGNRV